MSHPASSVSIFIGIIRRDLQLALRRKSDSLSALIFFAVVASLFPLGIGPETKLLMQIAPGMLWIAALLAAMLSLHKLFTEDFIDGSLDQILLSTLPLPLVVLAKTIAHWLSSGLLLALVSPILALQFNLPFDSIGVLFFIASLRYTSTKFDWLNWCRSHLSQSRRWHPVILNHSPASSTSPHFWGRCRRVLPSRLRLNCPFFAFGCNASNRFVSRPYCHRC